MSANNDTTSTSTQTTQNYDQRVVAAPHAVAVSSSGGSRVNVKYQVLDGGAINKAFGFARAALADSISLAERSTAGVADAYADARGGEKKLLVAGGLVIVGIVAIAALKGGKL